MRRYKTILAVTVGGMLSLGACADTGGQWENPKKPWEEWSTDETECRDLARSQAEQDFTPRTANRPPASTGSGRFGGDWLDFMDTYSANKQEDNLMQRCMLQRGYRLVPRATAAS